MAFLGDPPYILLEDLNWDEIGAESDPKARLLAHIRIAGLDMHLEAWEVEYVDHPDGLQVQCAKEASLSADSFDKLCAMMDSSFVTTEIDGREYVLVATPYGA